MDANTVMPPAGYKLDAPGVPTGYTLDPQTSALGAAGRGALDALPFGDKAAAGVESAVGGKSYKDYLAEIDQLLAADKDQHPIAHYAGETAGTLAPLAIPGVGEALTAEGIGGRAAIGAGIGALQGASNNRNSSQLPQDILAGAGVGAVLNPIAGAAGDKISSVLGAGSDALDTAANAQAVKSGGFKPSMLGRLSSEDTDALGGFMNQNDLVSGDLPSRLQKARVLKQVYGSKIGEMGANAVEMNDATPYIDPLKQSYTQYSGSSTPEARQLGRTYLGGIKDIENTVSNGASYSDLQDLKEMYGGLAFATDHTVKNEAAADIYGTIKQMQSDAVSAAPDQFKSAMKGYSQSSDIVDGIQKQLGTLRSGSGGAGGGMGVGKLIRQLPGMQNPMIGVPTGAALMGAGKTFTGAMVAGQALNNPAFKAQAATGISGVLDSAAQKTGLIGPAATNSITSLLNHPDMAPYRGAFQQAAQGAKNPAEVEKSNAVTDFTLSQRDPKYAMAKQKASEDASNAQ